MTSTLLITWAMYSSFLKGLTNKKQKQQNKNKKARKKRNWLTTEWNGRAKSWNNNKKEFCYFRPLATVFALQELLKCRFEVATYQKLTDILCRHHIVSHSVECWSWPLNMLSVVERSSTLNFRSTICRLSMVEWRELTNRSSSLTFTWFGMFNILVLVKLRWYM